MIRTTRLPLPVLAAALAATLALAASCRPAPSTTGGIVVADAPAIPPRQAPRFPDGWRFEPGREAVFARQAMVVSNSEPATAAAL